MRYNGGMKKVFNGNKVWEILWEISYHTKRERITSIASFLHIRVPVSLNNDNFASREVGTRFKTGTELYKSGQRTTGTVMTCGHVKAGVE